MKNTPGYHITQDAVSSLQERIQWSKWKKSPIDLQIVAVHVLVSLNHLSYVPVLLSLWLTWCPGTAFSHSPDSHVLFSLTHLMSMYFFDSPELISMYYFFLLLTWADVHILLSLTHLSWCPCTSFSESPELMSIYLFLWLTWADVHVLLSLTHLSWCPYTSLTHLSWCPCTFLSDSPELGRLQHAVDDLDHHLLQHCIVGTHHGNQGVTHTALLQQLLTGLWISSSPCHSCTTWLCVHLPLKTL